MEDTFRPVDGYEGLYAVDAMGRVLSLQRTKRHWLGGSIPVREKLLSQHVDRAGYAMVHLCKEGKSRMIFVHRLVAVAFLGPRHGLDQVNHIDGVKSNNCASNLEWVSAKRNLAHAIENKLHHDPKGETNPRAKLTEEQVREIRSRPNGYGTRKALAEEFGVGVLCVSRIRSGKTWDHL